MSSPKITVNITDSNVGVVVSEENATLRVKNVYINPTNVKHRDFHLSKTIKSFQGRGDELNQLNSWLFKDKKKTAVICGLPGYGKTELARRFAHFCKEEKLVRSVLWLNAETPGILEQSLRDLLRWLGERNKADLDVQSVVQAVQHHFSSESHLFILDNAFDHRNVLGFEPEGKCCCILTSHLEYWGDDIASLKLIPLPLDDSVNVLRIELRHRFKENDLEQYKQLVEMLSCVPLALQVAAAYIRQEFDESRKNFCLRDYINRLQIPSIDVVDQSMPNSSANPYDKTFLQAIRISLHKIQNTAKYDSKLTADILHICAYLNPEEIFYNTLLEIPCLKKGKYHVVKSCALLRKYSFISVEKEKILIHRLIQHILCQISGNQMYFECLELLLEHSENYKIHSSFILKYAEYRLKVFDEFHTKYKLNIINNDIFFWHIINSNCKIFLIKILDELQESVADLINARCLLHCSVKCQQHTILELLLKSYKPNVDQLDENKCTALILAARMFQLYAIKTLAGLNADVNASQGDNSVLLEVTRASGASQNIRRSSDSVVAVRRLIDLGARVNTTGTRGRSIVHEASMALNPVLVQYLVQNHGCKVNAVDINKRTPLYYVTGFLSGDRRRQQDTVKCLVKLGARRDGKDYWGNTASQHARATGYSHVADYIDNPSSEIQESEPIVYELRSAVSRGDLSSVTRYLDLLEDRDVPICNEFCLLIEAVENKKYDVLEKLLSSGVHVNTTNTTSPLHQAAWNLDTRAMKLLLNHGADVNATNALGRSILHDLIFGIGESNNNAVEACKVLQWLVGQGALPNAITSKKVSLLHAASHALSPELIRLLVTEYNLSVSDVDEAGWTPLYWVCAGLRHWRKDESRGLDTARCLLELGARVNVLNVKGNTPARIASMYEYMQLATLLQSTLAWQVYGNQK